MQQGERELNQEEQEIYDRQSFIGHKVQRRLLNSNVLIIELTGSNTELAKNLILAGVNITICDDKQITEVDADTNFLFGSLDIGKQRGLVGKSELQEINPLVTIKHIETIGNDDDYKQYDIIVSSTVCFQRMADLDQVSKRYNIPYYNLVCCGFYGFTYISLGREFKYEREKRKVYQLVFGQKNKKEPEYKDFEEVTAHSVDLNEALNYKHQVKGMTQNIIYYAILMMKKAQEDPILQNYSARGEQDAAVLDKFMEIGCEIFRTAQDREPTEAIKATFRNFARCYGIDFCPVYSILGSVASQEMIITLSKVNEPANNWFCYDSEETYGFTEVVQDVNTYKYRDLPERRQLITDD